MKNEHIQRHKDGSIWAKGTMLHGVPDGYWEWFRKDGTKLRSGHFQTGKQVGEWTTYDNAGKVYKITSFDKKKGKRP
jgi:antitoxin component YwqK of YwqJK toxin-antitoxin module